MKVTALRTGWDGLQRRREGETFDWPKDKKLGSWVEAAEASKEAAEANADAERARERAAHAKAQREAIGQVVGNQGKSEDKGKE